MKLWKLYSIKKKFDSIARNHKSTDQRFDGYFDGQANFFKSTPDGFSKGENRISQILAKRRPALSTFNVELTDWRGGKGAEGNGGRRQPIIIGNNDVPPHRIVDRYNRRLFRDRFIIFLCVSSRNTAKLISKQSPMSLNFQRRIK